MGIIVVQLTLMSISNVACEHVCRCDRKRDRSLISVAGGDRRRSIRAVNQGPVDCRKRVDHMENSGTPTMVRVEVIECLSSRRGA